MSAPLILGQIGLTFHTAAAAVIAELLEEVGNNVVLREAPHEKMYALQQAGEVDLICSAWLPSSHQVYIAPYIDALEKLAVIYTPYCIWGIPEEAPAEIRSVHDLARPDIAKHFRKLIKGITPGAGISRFSRQMLIDYKLAEQGFIFENGTLSDCTGHYLEALTAQEMAIVPLWHPQWLHTETKLRELADPLGLLGVQDDATLVLRKDAKHKLSKQGMAILRNMKLGNAVVSQLDRGICLEGKAPREVAKAWVAENRALCDSWKV